MGGGAETNSKCAYRGFRFNRNVLGGGPTRSGVFRMWGVLPDQGYSECGGYQIRGIQNVGGGGGGVDHLIRKLRHQFLHLRNSIIAAAKFCAKFHG